VKIGITALYALAMIAGIIAGFIHKALADESQPAISITLLALWHDKDLWRAVLASPIVFGVVYGIASKTTDPIVATLLSFENGFFCNLILSKRRHAAGG
jgi:anti-sigma-K factor RskA